MVDDSGRLGVISGSGYKNRDGSYTASLQILILLLEVGLMVNLWS